jgi:pyruvate-formate lyase-activating enzyme
MGLETTDKTEEKNNFKIAHYIDVGVPIDSCNFRCHYCYITHNRLFSNKLPKFKHTPTQMAQAFSPKRFGGICVINLCAGGETLLAPEMPEIVRALLEEGHIIMVVTNGSISKAFDEFVRLPQELRNRLFIKFSFQYLELLRLKLLDRFFDNLQKMKNNGVSFTLEITPNDELIPHIEDIKKISIEKAGAIPHVTVARDERNADLPILTKLSREEYKKVWSQFDSLLFEFKESVFNVKQTDFCYGGQATYSAGLDSGILKQCYFEKTLMNLYDNVNKPVKEEPVGCNCRAPHCWNAHYWMGFGAIPSKNGIPLYAEMRDRVCADGSRWLVGDVSKAFGTRAEVGMPIIGKKQTAKKINKNLFSLFTKISNLKSRILRKTAAKESK